MRARELICGVVSATPGETVLETPKRNQPRRPKLTLQHVNELRKHQEKVESERQRHLELVQRMYIDPELVNKKSGTEGENDVALAGDALKSIKSKARAREENSNGALRNIKKRTSGF